MDENTTEAIFEDPQASRSIPQKDDFPKVRVVLLVLFGLVLTGALLGSSVALAVVKITGWPESLLSGILAPDAPPGERWPMRCLLAINHVFTFVLPGMLAILLFYRSWRRPDGTQAAWQDYLGVRQAPGLSLTINGLLLLLVSVPLVLFLYNLGQDIPWPDFFRVMEQQTEASVKGLLQMENLFELAGNLLIIALIPALGEELVFRGMLQRQLQRRIREPWLAILLAAGIFSFIHLQFEGFFARWLLGVLLGFLYWRTGNFWLPVAAHFFNNAIQVVGQYLYRQEVSALDLEKDIHIPWIAALGALLLVLLVYRIIDRQAGPVPGKNLSH